MSSVEPEQYANQHDRGKKRIRQLIVARGDCAEVFEFIEEPLDEVAFAIEGEIGVTRFEAVGLGRNDGHDAPLLEGVDQGVGIIGFVGQERLGLDFIEQRPGLADIGRLPRRERQNGRVAKRIDDGVDLGGQPSTGPTDGLVAAFFFLAPALCW